MQRYVASKDQWLQCRVGEDQADIECVKDVEDAARRGLKDAAGVDDAAGVAGVNDAGSDAGVN